MRKTRGLGDDSVLSWVFELDSDCQNSDCHKGDFIIAIV